MCTTRKIKGTIIAMAAIMAIVMYFLAASASADGYEIGDVITFGTYEQDNNRRDGAEDIQ